jgi:hypothetical protein
MLVLLRLLHWRDHSRLALALLRHLKHQGQTERRMNVSNTEPREHDFLDKHNIPVVTLLTLQG